MSNPHPTHKYKKKYEEVMSEQPLTVRVPLSLDQYVRSLPNRTEWLRKVIAEAAEREMQQESA